MMLCYYWYSDRWFTSYSDP